MLCQYKTKWALNLLLQVLPPERFIQLLLLDSWWLHKNKSVQTQTSGITWSHDLHPFFLISHCVLVSFSSLLAAITALQLSAWLNFQHPSGRCFSEFQIKETYFLPFIFIIGVGCAGMMGFNLINTEDILLFWFFYSLSHIIQCLSLSISDFPAKSWSGAFTWVLQSQDDPCCPFSLSHPPWFSSVTSHRQGNFDNKATYFSSLTTM